MVREREETAGQPGGIQVSTLFAGAALGGSLLFFVLFYAIIATGLIAALLGV